MSQNPEYQNPGQMPNPQMPQGGMNRPPVPPQPPMPPRPPMPGPQPGFPPQGRPNPGYPNGPVYQGGPYYQPPRPPMPPQQPQKGNGAKAAIIILLLLLVAGVGLVLANEFGLFETHEHEWQAATCGAPQTCATCGAVEGEPLSHNWQAATCVSPAYCTSCGAVEGEPLGHQWMEASYDAPKTCQVCYATEGKALVDPIYLNEMPFLDKVGKLWTSSEFAVAGPVHTSTADLSVWKQESIPGHTQGPVYDHYGNRYTYGMFLDGSITTTYFISYNLEGKYSTFSCYVAFPGSPLSKHAKESVNKIIEFYVDGKLVATTPKMSINAGRAYIEFDVTDGQVLTIQYANVSGNNEAATIFDPLLS